MVKMSVCEVLSCKSSYETGRTYHRFPIDPLRRKEWIKILGLKSTELKCVSGVCTKHFRPKDYYPGGKRLLSDAVPVLRLNKSVTKGGKSNKPVLKKANGKVPRTQSKVNERGLVNKSTIKVNTSSKIKKHLNSSSVKNNSNTKLALGKLSNKVVKNVNKSATQNNVKSKIQQRNPVKVGNGVEVPKGNKETLISKKNVKSQDGIKPKASIANKTLSPSRRSLKNKLSSRNNSRLIQDNAKNIKEIKTSEIQSKINNNSAHSDSSKSTSPIVFIPKVRILEMEKNNLKVDSTKSKESLKRNFQEVSSDDQGRGKRKKKMRMFDEFQNSQIFSVKTHYNDNSSIQLDQINSKSDCNITNIEQKILEMQNKIKRLEKKATLDEQKIDKFKKALIEQRKNDFKILMDEKENELLLRMDLLYLDYDPQRICRLCLLLVDKKEALTSLLWPPQNQALISLIKSTTNVQIEIEDGMPSGICNDCLQQIRKVDWIRRRSQRSNMLIKKFTAMKKGINENNNSGTIVANSTVNEKQQFSDDLFEEEIFKIEDVFSLENSPESIPFEMTLKQEPESDEEIITVPSDQEPCANSTKVSVKKLQRCKICRATFTNRWTLNNHYKYCNKRFQCSECGKCFWNSQLFLAHQQRRQLCASVETKRCCYNCQIVFRWKWQLVFHVLQHSPQLCELCDEVLHSVEHLKQHLISSHIDY